MEYNADRKLATVIKLLHNQKNKLADILALLRQFFPDDSDFVSVLKELLRRCYFSASLAIEIETEINSRCQDTNQRAKTTRAGINIALKAKQFSYQTALSAMQLRQLYRDFISQDIEPLWFYEKCVNQYGYDKRFLIIYFVLQSLLCDMQALSPSCSFMPEFAVSLSSLGRIKKLSSADKIFFAYCSNLPFGFSSSIEHKNTVSAFIKTDTQPILPARLTILPPKIIKDHLIYLKPDDKL